MVALYVICIACGIGFYISGKKNVDGDTHLDDLMASPVIIVLWPFLFLVMGHVFALFIFALIVIPALLLNVVGTRFGIPFFGDAIMIVVFFLGAGALLVHVKRDIAKNNSPNSGPPRLNALDQEETASESTTVGPRKSPPKAIAISRPGESTTMWEDLWLFFGLKAMTVIPLYPLYLFATDASYRRDEGFLSLAFFFGMFLIFLFTLGLSYPQFRRREYHGANQHWPMLPTIGASLIGLSLVLTWSGWLLN